MTLFAEGRIIDVDSKVRMPQWNLLLFLLLLLLLMMMMTTMISVELEGVTQRQTDRQTESALDCVLEKKLPSSNSSSSTLGLLFWLSSLLARSQQRKFLLSVKKSQ